MLSNNVSLSVPTENISARPFAGVRVSYDRWEGAEGGSSVVHSSCYADMNCVRERERAGMSAGQAFYHPFIIADRPRIYCRPPGERNVALIKTYSRHRLRRAGR